MRDADRVQVAESLYMRGFISYPRTETDSFDVNFDHRTLMERQVPHTQWGNYAQRYDAERWTPTVGWPNAMGPCLPLCLTPSPAPRTGPAPRPAPQAAGRGLSDATERQTRRQRPPAHSPGQARAAARARRQRQGRTPLTIERTMCSGCAGRAAEPVDGVVPGAQVYEFVTRRYLACISDDARGDETVLELEMGGEIFSASGVCPLSPFRAQARARVPRSSRPLAMRWCVQQAW